MATFVISYLNGCYIWLYKQHAYHAEPSIIAAADAVYTEQVSSNNEDVYCSCDHFDVSTF